jgi:helicase SWR1
MYLAVTKHICDAIKARAELSLYGQVVQGRLVRGTAKAKGSKKQRDDPETAWRKKLAKETLELVVDQWKRVVLASVIIVFRTVRAHAFEFFKFVREKRRAEEEEEERRRGQEHLDAILDQSRNILQSQHVNLSRAAGKPLAEAGTRSQSRLTRGDPDDDSDHEAEEEGQAAEVEGSSDEDKEGHEEGTMALLGGSGPSSPPETDVDQERPTVHSRHTSPDDVDQFPATPSSLDTMDVDNLLRLSDSVGDGIPMDLQPPDPIKELVTSVSSPAEIPPESSEPDYHEPDLMPARPSTPPMEDGVDEEAMIQDDGIECYLRPYAVTKVNGWGPDKPVESSPLLRGSLRPYQLAGLKWLANHHTQLFNCILSDEMGRLSYLS